MPGREQQSDGCRQHDGHLCGDQDNPQFHVPKTITGVAQQPGQRFMVSTGIWDRVNGVGSPELVAGTTLHEVGHNGGLWHGGPPPVWNGQKRYVEPNCKPNYTSIMSYAFQVIGLRDDAGNTFFDYSRDGNVQSHDLDETVLSDGTFTPAVTTLPNRVVCAHRSGYAAVPPGIFAAEALLQRRVVPGSLAEQLGEYEPHRWTTDD